MEVILAKNSGFCFGVKQAIKSAEEQAEINKGKTIYTCGPLIHNTMVTGQLEAKGIKIIDSLEQCKEGDIVIVRSHGEPKSFYDDAKAKKLQLVDATCPFVAKIHDLVHQAHEEGYQIAIIGDANHPEVIGINGWCDNSAIIVNSVDDAEAIDAENLFIVCQTTIKKDLVVLILPILDRKDIQYQIKNTICNATSDRQKSCKEVAKECEAMVIVGDRKSSNTQKLKEIAKDSCKNTFFVENIEDLPLKTLKNYSKIGVAAGASTPEFAIKEVIATMSEIITDNNEMLTMADFMDDIDKSLRLPRVGEIVNGTVHQVTEKEIIVNMGCKKDGIIPKEEVTLEGEQKLSDLFKEGDEIEAKVIKTDDGDGGILLSKKKLEINAHWKEIEDAMENKTVINVKVVRPVNGGVIATYKEVSGFIPLSQLSDKFVENADEFIGQDLDVRVTRVDQRRGRTVFSHKVILAEEKAKQLEAVWESIHVDDIVEGTVMRFTDYGAFVDLGGIDGLLHISEISWGKLKNPGEVLEIGQKIQVKILSMNAEKGKISLGLKQTRPEPWSVINENYQVGQVVSGKVVQIKEYGAFVELEPGLDGLVHISEVAHKRLNSIADELEVGQVVDAKILEIDEERKRISLSIKATVEPPVVEDAAEEPAEEVVEAEAEAVSETEE